MILEIVFIYEIIEGICDVKIQTIILELLELLFEKIDNLTVVQRFWILSSIIIIFIVEKVYIIGTFDMDSKFSDLSHPFQLAILISSFY